MINLNQKSNQISIQFISAATGIILLYTRWMIRHCYLLMRGKNLEPFTLINRNKYHPPELVKFGLTDIPQYPGGNWRWKHKKWTFYASRGNRPYMEDRMHYLNDPHHNFVMFSIFDGHGGPVICILCNIMQVEYFLNLSKLFHLNIPKSPGNLDVCKILLI
ncbi:unnamed protein product [Onchocerca flexuosa]|uniref:PPM-type phosphatase domain-containing protein n=1 Tax=Onchocerca flexuosa TaxID=387005 RepID=A0A183HNG9_9BILA|nr:unnamed protein product [Onchocerca flexuosa]